MEFGGSLKLGFLHIARNTELHGWWVVPAIVACSVIVHWWRPDNESEASTSSDSKSLGVSSFIIGFISYLATATPLVFSNIYC